MLLACTSLATGLSPQQITVGIAGVLIGGNSPYVYSLVYTPQATTCSLQLLRYSYLAQTQKPHLT